MFGFGKLTRDNLCFMADLVLFVNDVTLISTFYSKLLGCAAKTESEVFIHIRNETCDILVHQIPSEYLEPLQTPTQVRDDCAWKPIFDVPSISDARELAKQLGGNIQSAAAEWTMGTFTYCDGYDPEGNVIQFRAET